MKHKSHGNNKRAFTLIEVLVSLILLSLVLFISFKAYKQMAYFTKLDEIRYLALNKIDSEMARLVYAYREKDEDDFTFDDDDTAWGNKWDDPFSVPDISRWKEMRIYENNPVNGLNDINIDGRWNILRNVVELIDMNNNPNIVDSGDIVGSMAWRIEYHNELSPKIAHLSLSITYPYIANIQTFIYGNPETNVTIIEGYSTETINLKTSTRLYP